jgi:hypothetical protein
MRGTQEMQKAGTGVNEGLQEMAVLVPIGSELFKNNLVLLVMIIQQFP